MTPQLAHVLAQAETLPPDEQMQVIAHLAERNRQAWIGDPAPRWASLCGLAPDLLAGEDAQAYVARTRHEAEMRAAFGLTLTDAFQLACAAASGCDSFSLTTGRCGASPPRPSSRSMSFCKRRPPETSGHRL